MRMPRKRQVRAEAGFTLIEVMVTIVLTTVGLLGFAGLLTKAVKANRQAYMRTQADIMAYDLAERMRVNRPAAVSGGYNLALGSVPSGSSVAATDLQDWRGALTRTLPAGNCAVTVDGSGNVTITVQWDDDSDGVPTVFTTQTTI